MYLIANNSSTTNEGDHRLNTRFNGIQRLQHIPPPSEAQGSITIHSRLDRELLQPMQHFVKSAGSIDCGKRALVAVSSMMHSRPAEEIVNALEGAAKKLSKNSGICRSCAPGENQPCKSCKGDGQPCTSCGGVVK